MGKILFYDLEYDSEPIYIASDSFNKPCSAAKIYSPNIDNPNPSIVLYDAIYAADIELVDYNGVLCAIDDQELPIQITNSHPENFYWEDLLDGYVNETGGVVFAQLSQSYDTFDEAMEHHITIISSDDHDPSYPRDSVVGMLVPPQNSGNINSPTIYDLRFSANRVEGKCPIVWAEFKFVDYDVAINTTKDDRLVFININDSIDTKSDIVEILEDSTMDLDKSELTDFLLLPEDDRRDEYSDTSDDLIIEDEDSIYDTESIEDEYDISDTETIEDDEVDQEEVEQANLAEPDNNNAPTEYVEEDSVEITIQQKTLSYKNFTNNNHYEEAAMYINNKNFKKFLLSKAETQNNDNTAPAPILEETNNVVNENEQNPVALDVSDFEVSQKEEFDVKVTAVDETDVAIDGEETSQINEDEIDVLEIDESDVDVSELEEVKVNEDGSIEAVEAVDVSGYDLKNDMSEVYHSEETDVSNADGQTSDKKANDAVSSQVQETDLKASQLDVNKVNTDGSTEEVEAIDVSLNQIEKDGVEKYNLASTDVKTDEKEVINTQETDIDTLNVQENNVAGTLLDVNKVNADGSTEEVNVADISLSQTQEQSAEISETETTDTITSDAEVVSSETVGLGLDEIQKTESKESQVDTTKVNTDGSTENTQSIDSSTSKDNENYVEVYEVEETSTENAEGESMQMDVADALSFQIDESDTTSSQEDVNIVGADGSTEALEAIDSSESTTETTGTEVVQLAQDSTNTEENGETLEIKMSDSLSYQSKEDSSDESQLDLKDTNKDGSTEELQVSGTSTEETKEDYSDTYNEAINDKMLNGDTTSSVTESDTSVSEVDKTEKENNQLKEVETSTDGESKVIQAEDSVEHNSQEYDLSSSKIEENTATTDGKETSEIKETDVDVSKVDENEIESYQLSENKDGATEELAPVDLSESNNIESVSVNEDTVAVDVAVDADGGAAEDVAEYTSDDYEIFFFDEDIYFEASDDMSALSADHFSDFTIL